MGQLIDTASKIFGTEFIPAVKVTPLGTIDRAEVFLLSHRFVGGLVVTVKHFRRRAPLVPNFTTALLKPRFVGHAFDESL